MASNKFIEVHCFDLEIARIGYDEDAGKTTFQYNRDYLESGVYPNLFPLIIKRTKTAQAFFEFNNETFRGLPPMIADSLPDMFGNLIFKAWLEARGQGSKKISVLEQLTYVANRGMGALEYRPAKAMPKDTNIDISEITEILKKVLESKSATVGDELSSEALLNIFKIGTSAGGARPKILVSRHRETGKIIPGDIEIADDYQHLLVKLSLGQPHGYSTEVIEYAYYQTATALGIDMMPSGLIDDKHFATERFDRQHGEKVHMLTASGMTGWDFNKPGPGSSYENLFKLALHIGLPQRDIEQLYRRMVFNLCYFNIDDHLKNHAFLYDKKDSKWALAPAYDITFALNPELNITKSARALSIGGKRTDIGLRELLALAEQFTIKNPKGVIAELQEGAALLEQKLLGLAIPERTVERIKRDFVKFL